MSSPTTNPAEFTFISTDNQPTSNENVHLSVSISKKNKIQSKRSSYHQSIFSSLNSLPQSKTMPDPEQLDKDFELLLAEMALPHQKQEKMRAFEPERKWILLQQHLQKNMHSTAALVRFSLRFIISSRQRLTDHKISPKAFLRPIPKSICTKWVDLKSL